MRELRPASDYMTTSADIERAQIRAGRPWLCECGHALYLHGRRKEPNSGKLYFAGCSVDECLCDGGKNATYPTGDIHGYK